ncbi:Uncharacterised protein [Yersinia rohdei]|uniref:hypothetical protein n=1 Tax=Yersinia rohdei TaxID=29485 RepID=UPI00061BCBCE|nr:hypothetical protein [Yersinia rohdei]CNF17415.1 Uncharacterised protein [Yersinia rohdei]
MKIDIAALQNAVTKYTKAFENHQASPLSAEALWAWDAADAELSSVINNDETNIIVALLAKLETAEKEISDWRSIAEAASQDDANWHDMVDSKNEVISQLASGIIQLKERAESADKARDVYSNLASDVGDIITILQNNEWAEHVGKTNVGGLLEHQITRLMNSIADINTELSVAEARLLVPVKLPERYSVDCGVCEDPNGDWLSFNEVVDALQLAGYPVEGGE